MSDSHTSLSLLVAYGHWLFLLALPMLVPLGIGLVSLYARAKLARHARLQRGDELNDPLGPDEELHDGELVTLRGRIEGPEGGCWPLHDEQDALLGVVRSSRRSMRQWSTVISLDEEVASDSLTLRIGDKRIAIAGASRLLSGTRQWWSGQRASKPSKKVGEWLSERLDDKRLAEIERARDGRELLFFEWVNRGDEVLARGRLRLIAAGEEEVTGDYRRAAKTFCLEPADKEGKKRKVEIAAARAPRVQFAFRLLLVRGVLAAIALAFAVNYFGGDLAWKTGAYELAAMFPNQRQAALQMLYDRAKSDDALRGQARIERLRALGTLAGKCDEKALVLFEHGRFRAAAKAYADCSEKGSVDRAATAWVILGELGKVSDLYLSRGGGGPKDGVFVATIHLLAGRPKDAAASLRSYLAAPKEDALEAKKAEKLGCLVDALLARDGNAPARGRLAKQKGELCRLLHADLLVGPERRAALGDLLDVHKSLLHLQEYRVLSRLLAAEVGHKTEIDWQLPDVPYGMGRSAIDLMIGGCLLRAHGLEHEVLARLRRTEKPTRQEKSLRARLAFKAACFEMGAGHLPLAEREAQLAEVDALALLDAERETFEARPMGLFAATQTRFNAMAMRVMVALLAGKHAQAEQLLKPWLDPARAHYFAHLAPPDSTRRRGPYYAHRDIPYYWSRVVYQILPVVRTLGSLLDVARGRSPRDLAALQPNSFGFSLFGWPSSWGSSPKNIAKREQAWLLAARGNGQELLSTLRAAPPYLGGPLLPLGVAKLRSGGKELLAWLRYERYPRRKGVGSPRMIEAASMARVAELLGSPVLQAEQRAIAERFHRAMTARAIAVPYYVLMAK